MKKLLTLLVISLASFTSFLFADLGPKPTMSVTIQYQTPDLNKVMSGELIQYYSGNFMSCDILSSCNTQKVLEDLWPQSFSCSADSCSSASYWYTKYNKIVLYFVDGKRETHVFENKDFNAKYLIVISATGIALEKLVVPAWDTAMSDEEIVQLAHEQWYTKYDTVKWFMRDKPITREQATKFFIAYVNHLGLENDSIACITCSKFYDENAFDISLKESIYKLCSYGLMKGSKWNFSPKNNISFFHSFIVFFRMNGHKDTIITEQFVKDNLMDLGTTMDTSFLKPYLSDYNQVITRGDLLKLLILASN